METWKQGPQPEKKCQSIGNQIRGGFKPSQVDKLAQNRNNTQLLSCN